MNKKLAAILAVLVSLALCACLAVDAFTAFAPDEFAALKGAMQNAQPLKADIDVLDAYIANPTYEKTAARAALNDLRELADALEKLSAITDAKADGSGTTYVLNVKSMKFHYPTCSGTRDIKLSINYTGTRGDVVAYGFEPCGRCKP